MIPIMTRRAFFTFFAVLVVGINLWSEADPSGAKKQAILSFAIPSQLNWKQNTGEEAIPDMQIFTLEDTEGLKLSSVQVGNEALWPKFSTMDKEKIFQELVEGKKTVHAIAGVKNWKADKALTRKSDNEIIFEVTGSYTEDTLNKYFIEKYYMTPYGFILMTLDWTDISEKNLVKKAQAEFKNVSFKMEIK